MSGRTLRIVDDDWLVALRLKLSSRLEQIPLKRVRRRADYWALRQIEEEHVKQLARSFGLFDVESERLTSWWLGEIDSLLSARFQDLFVDQELPRRMPQIRPKTLFQIWFNTLGPGGRCWFGNRYVAIRRCTFRLRWRP